MFLIKKREVMKNALYIALLISVSFVELIVEPGYAIVAFVCGFVLIESGLYLYRTYILIPRTERLDGCVFVLTDISGVRKQISCLKNTKAIFGLPGREYILADNFKKRVFDSGNKHDIHLVKIIHQEAGHEEETGNEYLERALITIEKIVKVGTKSFSNRLI